MAGLVTVAVTCGRAVVGGAGSEVGGRLGARGAADLPGDPPRGARAPWEGPLTRETRFSRPAGRTWTFRTIGLGGPGLAHQARTRPPGAWSTAAGRGLLDGRWRAAGGVLVGVLELAGPARRDGANPPGRGRNLRGGQATIEPPPGLRSSAGSPVSSQESSLLGTFAEAVWGHELVPVGREAALCASHACCPDKGQQGAHRAADRPLELGCCCGVLGV